MLGQACAPAFAAAQAPEASDSVEQMEQEPAGEPSAVPSAAPEFATSLEATAAPETEPAADPEPEPAPESEPPARKPEDDPWVLQTKDKRFTLKIGAQIQVRYSASDAEKPSEKSAFKIQQARPQLRASLGKPWVTVFFQPELANVPQLLDLELTLLPLPEIGLKVGQFLTPFSRTFYTPVPKLLFQDFSIANNAFRADRQTGAMLFGSAFQGKAEYYAGAFNGNRINQNGNDDDKMLFAGRVAVNPLGAIAYDETPALMGPQPLRLGLGINGFWGKVPPVAPTAPAFPLPTGTDPTLTPLPMASRDTLGTVGADLAIHVWHATLQAEYYFRSLDRGAGGPVTQGQGAYVHASTFLYFPYLEAAVRVSYVDLDRSAKGDQTFAYEGAFNVYGLGNNLKLNLRYTRFDLPQQTSQVSAPASQQFLAQTQWYF